MLSFLALYTSAILAATATQVAAVPTAFTPGDRALHPCERADIPWQGNEGPFHLSASDPALVNVTSPSLRHQWFWVKERVFISPGDQDDIVVSFDVKLTDDRLQDAVTIADHKRDVSLLIETSDAGDERGPPPGHHHHWDERECIVATTQISVPKRLSDLAITVDNAPIIFENVNSTFENLELSSSNGGVYFKSSYIRVKHLLKAALTNGPFKTWHSTLVTKDSALESHNGAIAARISGNPIETLDVSSVNGAVNLVVLDDGESSSSSTSNITTHSHSGSVRLSSYIPHTISLSSTSQSGHISTSLYNVGVAGAFRAKTKVGHTSVSGDVKITKSDKTIVGNLFEGFFGGDEDEGSYVDLEASVGAIEFYVDERKHEEDGAVDGRNVEPGPWHGENEWDDDGRPRDGDDDDDDRPFPPPPGPGHGPHGGLHLGLIIVAVGLVAGLSFHVVRRYLVSRRREGYVRL